MAVELGGEDFAIGDGNAARLLAAAQIGVARYSTPSTAIGVISVVLVMPVWMMAVGRSVLTLDLLTWVKGEKR